MKKRNMMRVFLTIVSFCFLMNFIPTYAGETDFVIMKNASATSIGNIFGDDYTTKDKIATITIKDNQTPPEGVVHTWDASQLGNESVKIWLVQNATDDSMYDMIIGGTGKIIPYNGKASQMFAFYTNCTSITGLENLSTENITSMDMMFCECSNLESIQVENWDVSKVTTMESMFRGCSGLTSIPISEWDTGNVLNMSYMFQGCSGLSSIAVDEWNTSNVSNMSYMFYGCNGLSSIAVDEWNTSNVSNMSYMFYGCNKLSSVAVNEWNTGNVLNMSSMFSYCTKLSSIPVANWDTSKVESMSNMFSMNNNIGGWGATGVLTNIDVSKWNTENVKDMSGLFKGQPLLTNLAVDNWNTGKVTNMCGMFGGCVGLTVLPVSNWNVSKVTNVSYFVYGCIKLTSLDLSNWSTGKITNMSNMVYNCAELTTLDLSYFDTRTATNMSSFAKGLPNLKRLTIGENFVFKSNDCIDSYSSDWRRIGTSEYYSSTELMGASIPGTYDRESTDCSIVKLDVDTNETLSGVEFYLQNTSDEYLTSVNDISFSSDENEAYIFTTNDEGVVKIPSLPHGSYLLTEIKTLTGYTKNAYSYIIESNELGMSVMKADSIVYPEITSENITYKNTEDLMEEDKTDRYQKNYQEVELEGYKVKKSAEWENIEEGKVKIKFNISRPELPEFSEPFPDVTGTKVVYALTTCTAHGLGYGTAIRNIELLLVNYDVVDIIIANGPSVNDLVYLYDVQDAEQALEGINFKSCQHWGVNLYTGLDKYLKEGNVPDIIYTSFDLVVMTSDGDKYTDDSTWELLKQYEDEGKYFSLTGDFRLDKNTSTLAWKTLAGLVSPNSWNGFDGEVDIKSLGEIPYEYKRDFEVLNLELNVINCWKMKHPAVIKSTLTDTVSPKLRILSIDGTENMTYLLNGNKITFDFTKIDLGQEIEIEVLAELKNRTNDNAWFETNYNTELVEKRRIDGIKGETTIAVESPKLAELIVSYSGDELSRDSNDNYIITNEKMTNQSFTIIKYDESGNPLDNVEFTLVGVLDDGNEFEKVEVTNSEGRAEFTDISEGEYFLSETRAKDGYEATIENIEVKVTKDKIAIYGLSESTTNTYIVTNTLKPTFFVKKVGEDGNALGGTHFSIIGTTYEGVQISEEITTDDNGIIELEIDDGVYVLDEIVPTNGYTMGSKTNWRIVKSDGKLTVDDAELTGNLLEITNQLITSSITITKVWEVEPSDDIEPEIIIQGYDGDILKYQNTTDNDPSRWQKNGTTWTYSFDISDASLDYKAWEELVGDYKSSNTDENPLDVVIGEDNTIYNNINRYSYTVKYILKDTDKVVQEDKVVEGNNEGDVISAIDEKITLPNYNYNSSNVETLIIGNDESKNIIILYYTKKSSGGSIQSVGKVIIKCVDKETGEKLAEQVISGQVGTNYSIDEKEIDGYKLVETIGNTSGKYQNGTIEVIFYFEELKHGADINYQLNQDDDGTHEWYLRGYDDYTFRLNNNITREEIATIFYRLTVVPDRDIRQSFEVTENPFVDVDKDRWSARPIAYMKMLKIMNGYPDGTFAPSKPITRAEFAEVIKKFASANTKKVENMFTDVVSEYWATDAIQTALSEGWVQGYEDGTFKPERNITRVETVVIINRMLNRSLSKEHINDIKVPVVDLDPNHWGYADVLEAVTSHVYEKNDKGEEIWVEYRYPFHEDMSKEAENDV